MNIFKEKPVRLFLLGYIVFLVLGLVLLLYTSKGDAVLCFNSKANAFFDDFFQFITLFGLGGVFAVPIILALFVRYSYAITGTIALILTGVFTYLFKQVLFNGMPRPTAFFNNNELHHFIDGFAYHAHNSFPSGHTMTAFALVFFAAIIINKKIWSLPLLALGVLIGLSRIYLLQHFLMDVVVGSALGVLCTYIGYVISVNGLEKKFSKLSKHILLSKRKS